jgi:predicted AlkP superfamily phosphohydrolase/phosphomutase
VERVRSELVAKLAATVDDQGQAMGTLVFQPEETYREVRNIAPDLIVHFGGLDWRSVGGVGYQSIHVQENDTGPDDCNHGQFGAFLLAAPGCPLDGVLEDVHLLDITPTLLELGGYDVPDSMQGQSLLARQPAGSVPASALSSSDQEIIRQRLSGLGYI